MKTVVLFAADALRAGAMLLALSAAAHTAADDDAKAPDVKAMEEIADLALVPPKLNTSPLPDYGYDRLDYGMTVGIERTPGGRLWACWVAGGDSPKAFFVLATSDDDGRTWSPPRLVVDSHSQDLPRPRSVLVGNLWTDPLGRLWLIFDQSMETIYISYDRNRATDGEILMARFTEADILARKLIGPKSKLKMLISRPLASC